MKLDLQKIESGKVNLIEKLRGLFRKKKTKSIPLLLIKRFNEDGIIKEYDSIEAAITDLENDPNISIEKLEKLKSSVKNLKNITLIKIRNGEIIK